MSRVGNVARARGAHGKPTSLLGGRRCCRYCGFVSLFYAVSGLWAYQEINFVDLLPNLEAI